MYTKYLTDRGQRLAFIETHKAMEHKKESEKEYQRTQKLLDSSRCSFVINFELYIYFLSPSLSKVLFIDLTLYTLRLIGIYLYNICSLKSRRILNEIVRVIIQAYNVR